MTLHLTDETPHAEMLRVYVRGAETPIAGRYTPDRGSLTFAPAFAFEPGQDYVAQILTNGKEAQVAFRIPAEAEITPAAVTEIYPSGDTLPENTLRFYIHFTVPMQPQVAFDHIKLRNASGAVDEAAFMRFKQELWNEDRTRLTVLIDPGRIKREVATNLELGPALLAGQQYALTVEAGWSSADGTSALSTFRKTFQISDALRTRPDTRLWTANSPCAGVREPLTITFDRPFDRHLLTQALRVETETSDAIRGEIDVKEAEQIWSFTPLEPWPAKDLLLLANPALEDVAGNNFRDLLDDVAGVQESEKVKSELMIRTRNCAG
ncbi:hypothetical protein [Roseibium sp. MMSF_3412]|uniref:hypothetical protein n=1 Tax=Roseibium sp. MMSF_3412 TaxID=3046712 RepID=UPI00273D2C74|nr:hypothetical protein [Roseibium sp. MMSF_3412]